MNSRHSDPAPTAAGIKSEASNPNVDFGLARYVAESLSTWFLYAARGTPLLAEIQLSSCTRDVANVADDRYACTAATSLRLEKAAVNSPPPTTGTVTFEFVAGR